MRAWFTRLMAGRNGPDHLNRFLSVVFLILSVCSMFVRNPRIASAFYTLSMALFLYVMFRMFSRNIYRRQQENGAYLRERYKITSWWNGLRDRWTQRKDYKFFKCPSCHTRLRVPKGKGKLNIVCRKCGTSFQRRT
ncbi:MAG: hypothetical protein IJI27_05075 [Oscillospiraceae bacterium]|nr:hypothetical protein [Oscillospiraceae bacterium]